MSSEAVKKRGRPKKVISEPLEPAIVKPPTKATTRTKATKAASKPTKTTTAKASASAKVPKAEKTVAKPIEKSASVTKSAPSSSPTPSKSEPPKPSAKHIKAGTTSAVTTKTSKILSQVRDLSAKNSAPPTIPPNPPKSPQGASSSRTTTDPQPKSTASEPSPIPSTILTKTKTTTSPPLGQKVVNPDKKYKKPSTSLDADSIPIHNAREPSKVVTGITTRPAPRPGYNPYTGKPLPKNYKAVARAWTVAIVGLPIIIVTSYELYQRLVLGKERKSLGPRPGLTAVEELKSSIPDIKIEAVAKPEE